MILRKGASGEALPCEDHKPDIVIGAIGDEAHGDLLGRLYAVGLEVHSEHARGDVHREHDIDTLYLALCPARRALRTSKGNNDGREPQQT